MNEPLTVFNKLFCGLDIYLKTEESWENEMNCYGEMTESLPAENLGHGGRRWKRPSQLGDS